MNTGKVENMARAAALAMFSIQGSLCRDVS